MNDANPPELGQIRRIAWQVWDPLGLNPPDPSYDDEYDSYLRHVVALLQEGRPESDAIDYLVDVESDNMGLESNTTAQERAGTAVGAIAFYLGQLAAPVRRFELDASRWKTEDDLWQALLACLGAPAWHGHNYDALWETVTEAADFGLRDRMINHVQAPFEIIVMNASRLGPHLASRLQGIAKVFGDARAEYGLVVGLRQV